MQMKESLVKSRPLWGSVLAHKAEMFSHRGFTNGFFFAHLFPHLAVLRTIAGAASGAARKKTATRYDYV